MRKPKPTDAERDAARGYTDADIAEVSDNPEWTAADVARAKPFADAFPEMAAGVRREPQDAPAKQPVSLRLDRAIVEHFKAGGPGWQKRINDALARVVREGQAGKR